MIQLLFNAALPKKELEFFVECNINTYKKRYFIIEDLLNDEKNNYYGYLYCFYYDDNNYLNILCYDLFDQWRDTKNKISYFTNNTLIELI